MIDSMTPGAPRNMDDPDYLAERQWGAAISRWFEHEPSALAALIRASDSLIPDFAREFLADLAEGKVSRGKGGRPGKRYDQIERSIVAEVFAKWEHIAQAAAFDQVADCRGITPDAVRGLVDKFRRQGWTRERWISWGRPDFKNIKP